MQFRRFFFSVYAILFCTVLQASVHHGQSVYESRPNDPKAAYFNPTGADVTEELQQVIDGLKEKWNYGIVYVPEGEYVISGTIYVPGNMRLIGYGKNRPVFRLKDNAPGYQVPDPEDKGEAKYMFWFVDSVEDGIVYDANSATFNCAFSNIDIVIGKGNPQAVALRTHYAQNSFISHVNIEIGDGKSGIFDVGNELQDVNFYGGETGIYTTKTSPGWQMTILDANFEGQRRAAIRTEEGGLTIRRMSVKRCPVGIELNPDRSDRIYMEDCRFENVSDCAVLESRETVSSNQLSVINTVARNVPFFARFRQTGRAIEAPANVYCVNSLTAGLHMDDVASMPEYRVVTDIVALKKLPEPAVSDIPALPSVSKWANVLDLGVVGDGYHDDTEALKKAIAEHDVLYFPQGWYKVSDSLQLREETVLIGMNPISTQIFLEDNTPAFSGFGTPVPMIETPVGGRNIVNSLGFDTSSYNYRAVGCKWQAGKDSYMNDIRFFGGHAITISRTDKAEPDFIRIPAGISSSLHPVSYWAKDKAWDNQHWSLWITNGGGGVFKDVWSPDSYASNGIYVSHTSTPSSMYEISVEHHARNEVRFNDVHNWRVYALQMEEEIRESPDVQPLELQDCSDMMFANLFMFRVIWIDTPLAYCIRDWGCRDMEFYNVHNFTQMRMTTDVTLYDINKDISVMPWELVRLSITGDEAAEAAEVSAVKRLATGFEYAEGMAKDADGNIYFSEQRMKRIYRWDASARRVSLLADLPWQVLSLACDTEDRVLACVKYYPQPGADEAAAKTYADAEGTTFSWWGNDGFDVRFISMDPDAPEETITMLEKKPMSAARGAEKFYLPSHRWRDLHDFDAISEWTPDSCFVALDGKTIIPECYDLLRASSMVEAHCGETVYISDEFDHRVVALKVAEDGSASIVKEFAPFGQFSAVPDGKGSVFVADGYIYRYDSEGHLMDTILLPERPASIIVSNGRLYAAARTSLYEIDY